MADLRRPSENLKTWKEGNWSDQFEEQKEKSEAKWAVPKEPREHYQEY